MRSFKFAGALILGIIGLVFLDLALYPCTFIRNDVHSLLTEPVDDVYLGTSHGKFNINPEAVELVTGRSGHNAANGNEYPVDSYYLVRLMVEKGLAPSRVVYVTTPEYFMMDKGESNNALLFFHEFPFSVSKLSYFWEVVALRNIREALFPWSEYTLASQWGHIRENLAKKLGRDYSIEQFATEEQTYHEDGHIAHVSEDPHTFTFQPGDGFSSDQVLPENVEWLRKLIDLCEKEQIEFVAIMAPNSIPVLNRYSDSFADAERFFRSFYKEEGVRFINFNTGRYETAFTHDITAFTDLDGHLFSQAAWDFSLKLGEILEEK